MRTLAPSVWMLIDGLWERVALHSSVPAFQWVGKASVLRRLRSMRGWWVDNKRIITCSGVVAKVLGDGKEVKN